MNRSMLIVICDFLVLSLLSLARFDGPATEPPPPAVPQQELSTEAPASQDVMESLSLALEQERQSREALLAQLSQTEQNLSAARQDLTERERILQERTRRLIEFQQNLQRKEEEARKLQADRAQLQADFAKTQSSVQQLREKLADTSTEARISQVQLQALQAELQRRQEEAQRMEQKMADLEKAQKSTEREKFQLATQLQVVETEKNLARAQIDEMRDEIEIVRDEKTRLQEQTTKLSEGVSALAEKSNELTQEIRENRPLAANTIFTDFIANRVQSDFHAVRRGLFGRDVARDTTPKTVLVNDGSRTYALFHVQDTPLEFTQPGIDWDWLTGNLRRQTTTVSIDQLWFLHSDPRVAVVPVTTTQAQQLGSKVYQLANDPYKFEDAVVVGANEGYYGECRFQIDATLPQYLKMEHSTLKGLFGKFNPSRGDLVFSKSGDVLGIMVNHEYCALLGNLSRARALRLGGDITGQRTGLFLAEMRDRIDRLPAALH